MLDIGKNWKLIIQYENRKYKNLKANNTQETRKCVPKRERQPAALSQIATPHRRHPQHWAWKVTEYTLVSASHATVNCSSSSTSVMIIAGSTSTPAKILKLIVIVAASFGQNDARCLALLPEVFHGGFV